MKNSIQITVTLIASLILSAVANSWADQLRAAAICSGAARLDNGSIVSIGQPLSGVIMTIGGDVTINTGIIPAMTQSANVVLAAPITCASLGSGGVFSFAFTTELGRNYIIETSTNMSIWMPVWTNLGTGSRLTFTNSTAAYYPCCFYRVVAW